MGNNPAPQSSHFGQSRFDGTTLAIGVNNGQVVQNTYVGNRNAEDAALFDDIIENTSFLLASEDSEKLHEGTREWLLDLLSQRIHDGSPCVILAADAGMGKSCVMGTLAMRHYSPLAKRNNRLACSNDVCAIHWFKFLNDEREAATCILSWAKQLCSSLPGYESCLPKKDGSTHEGVKAILDEAKRLEGRPLDQIRFLLSKFIIQPCNGIKEVPTHCILLVDALDECAEVDAFTAAVEGLWSVNTGRTKERAPKWLKLVMSTRRDTRTLERFREFNPIVLEQRADSGEQRADSVDPPLKDISERNREDLVKVIRSELRHAADDLVNKILEKSEGIFLWLQYQQDRLSDLEKQGKLTLAELDTLPKGLKGVYKEFFQRVRKDFETLVNGEFKDMYRRTLGIGVIAPRAPIPKDLWLAVLGLAEKNQQVMETADKAEAILSRLLIFDSLTNTIRAPHKSMVDFLKFDPSAESDIRALQIEPLEYHKELGTSLLNRLDALIPSRKMWDMGKYSVEDAYTLRHVVFHLYEGRHFEQASSPYLELERLIRIVDGARETGNVSRVIQEGEQLVKALGDRSAESPRLQLCLSILRLAQEALEMDARMLPGQIIGRLGMPPYDQDRLFFKQQVDIWVDEFVQSKGALTVAMPTLPWLSGLSAAGGSLQRVFTLDWGVLDIALRGSDEVLIASGSEVIGFDLRTGEQLRKLQGLYFVMSVLSADSRYVVTASYDGTARVWDLHSGEVKVLEGHSERAISVAISADSKYVVTGSEDATARVWDLHSGEVKVLHSAYLRLEAISAKYVVTASTDGTARVWDLLGGNEVKVLEGNYHSVVAISADSKYVVTGSEDGTARVWDLHSGEVKVLEGHSERAISVAISADSKYVVTCSEDTTARVWDLHSGEVKVLKGHSGAVISVAISAESKWVVTGSDDCTARVWELHSGNQVKVLKEHSGIVDSVAISADSKYVLTASLDLTARVWDLHSGEVKVLEGHSGGVNAVAISADSKYVVTGSEDGTTRVWDSHSGEVKVLEGHFERYSPGSDEGRMHSGSRESLVESPVTSVAISADLKYVVTGSEDGTVCVWDLHSGEVKVPGGHSEPVTSVAISANSEWVRTVDYDEEQITWSLLNGERVADEASLPKDLLFSIDDDNGMQELYTNRTRFWIDRTGCVMEDLHPDVNSNSVGFVLDPGCSQLYRFNNLVFGVSKTHALLSWRQNQA